MSVYKRGFIVTVMLAIVSLIVAIGLNYGLGEQFWCNVCLGVFGSAFLTAVTSLIGYFVERKRVTEGFFVETTKMLNELNKYQPDLSLEDKLNFYLSLLDYDVTTWDMYYGQMDFFKSSYRGRIYSSIYKPLRMVRDKVLSHAWQFRMHKNGTGRNEVAMQSFVDEIEACILQKTQRKLMVDENQEYVATGLSNKTVKDVFSELNGWYYEMMYGAKQANKVTEERNG